MRTLVFVLGVALFVAGCSDNSTPETRAEALRECISSFQVFASAESVPFADDERTSAVFQFATDWEGAADACWISVSTESSCRGFARLIAQGRSDSDWRDDPPQDPNMACPEHGQPFNVAR